jgi:hypothetical protein
MRTQNDVVGLEVKECMTGDYHQAYQKASIKTVRTRLVFVSVFALQRGRQRIMFMCVAHEHKWFSTPLLLPGSAIGRSAHRKPGYGHSTVRR